MKDTQDNDDNSSEYYDSLPQNFAVSDRKSFRTYRVYWPQLRIARQTAHAAHAIPLSRLLMTV
jgi:hypothetical protein